MWYHRLSNLLNSYSTDRHKSTVFSHFRNKNNFSNMHAFTCTVNRIHSLISKLLYNKAVGLDILSAKHLRFSDASISVYLSFYILCVSDIGMYFIRVLPLCYNIVSILKNTNGSMADVNNCRPIAVATVLSKLFEHIIYNFVMMF